MTQTTADIKYIPAKDGAEYTAISAAAVIHSAMEMLASKDAVGEVDIFGETSTAKSIREVQQLRRSRAADLLFRVATELKAFDAHKVLLTQDAYLGDNGDYRAAGYLASENEDDETGATVMVTWAALEGAEDMDDESSRCDWSKPASIVHYRLGDITDKAIVVD